MEVGASSDIGRVRQANQDAYSIWRLGPGDRMVAAGVADGMGGYEGGEIASSLALDAVAAELAAAVAEAGGGDLPALVRAAIRAANARVWAAGSQTAGAGAMGTTLTLAVIDGATCVIGHVGDSRAYLVRGDNIDQLTEDHSLVGELVRNGDLTEEEAMVHPQRNILTNAVGTHPDVRIDIVQAGLRPGDRLVLCSDGLTNLVTAREIPAALRQADSLQEAAERLTALANERGGHDNVTVVILAPDEARGAPDR